MSRHSGWRHYTVVREDTHRNIPQMVWDGLQRFIAQENAGHLFSRHAVISTPRGEIVLQNRTRQLANGRGTRSAITPRIADD